MGMPSVTKQVSKRVGRKTKGKLRIVSDLGTSKRMLGQKTGKPKGLAKTAPAMKAY